VAANAGSPQWPLASGDVSRRLRACDGTTTPFGPAAGWPRALRTVVEVVLASPVPMAVLWGSDLVALYNDAFAERLSHDHPALLGRALRRSGDATGLVDVARCERALAGESVTSADPTGDASSTLGALHYAPLRSDDGGIGGVLVTATGSADPDPASGERHGIGAAAGKAGRSAELEQRLWLAMEASSAGAWGWSTITNDAYWDDRCHEIYGFAPETPRTQEQWFASLHPDDHGRVVGRLTEIFETPSNDDWDMEFRAVSPTRGVVWLHGLGRAQRDPDGRVVSLTGIVLDVTSRKRAEARLRASEETLRVFFENAPAAVAMLDNDMRYLAVSRRWLSDFHLPANIIGKTHYEVFPEVPERWKEIHRRTLAGSVERSDEDYFERADGSVQWLKWQLHPWRTTAGDIGGMIMMSEDITESRRWNESQRVMIDELQHRTRNLVAVIGSIAQQTMLKADSMETFMAKFSLRLSALARVQGLLARSDREPITIGSLVHMELDALASAASSAEVHVEGPEVRLRKRDVQMLALAVHELATNARKYGALAADGGRLSVTWDVESRHDAGPELALDWIELGITGTTRGPEQENSGYGRTLVERALPYSLDARTAFEVGKDSFRCSIRLPLHEEAPGR